MLRSSGQIIEKEGKEGGDIYWLDQCGQHARARGPIRDAKTPKQSRHRYAFRRAITAWINHEWTQAEMDAWWVYCSLKPQESKKGVTYYWHPFLAFMHTNIYQCMNNLPIRYDPPAL